MKKIILAAAFIATSFTQAQEVSVELNGVEVADGYQYLTHETGINNSGKMDILVTNLTEENMRMKLKMTGLTNATNNTNKIQFCFGGDCFFSAPVDTTVPSAVGGTVIEPGMTNNVDDHLANTHVGDTPGQDVVYNMAVVEVNEAGTELGTLFTFSYKYSPTAGIDDFASLEKMGINLSNTLVKNTLDINAQQNAAMELYGMNGQSVKKVAITSGFQAIDLSGLAAGIYIAKFTNEENKVSQVRIVKN